MTSAITAANPPILDSNVQVKVTLVGWYDSKASNTFGFLEIHERYLSANKDLFIGDSSSIKE